MKRIFAAMLIVAICFSCTKTNSKNENSLEKVKAAGVFVLGLDDALPPLGFRDENNEIVGYDIDLARAVCAKLGLKLVLQPIDWSAKEQELNTGKIDCIWNGFTVTKERKKVILFSKPYMTNSQVAVVKKNSGMTELADLAGKTIGVQAGSTASDAIAANAGFKKSIRELVEFRDNLTAFMDLEIGGVDAVVLDSVVANYDIKTSGKDFVVLSHTLADEEYAVGFRKNDVELRDAVQKALDELKASGEIAKIDAKWFK